MPHIDTTDRHHTIRTYFTDEGSGQIIVLLHGGLESGAAWDDIAQRLAQSHRVLRPDRRGHGRTADVVGPYMAALMHAGETYRKRRVRRC